jgi:outer membrane protein OmpA-like peptidoglycan-associated protein
LGDVLFDTGQTELKAGSNRTLSRLARFLELNPQRRIRIEGYTDNVGKAQDNQRLSEARAYAIAAMLGEMNVAPSRMEVAGYGEQYPVAENASSSGRAQNRRVEIVFSDSQGVLTPTR